MTGRSYSELTNAACCSYHAKCVSVRINVRQMTSHGTQEWPRRQRETQSGRRSAFVTDSAAAAVVAVSGVACDNTVAMTTVTIITTTATSARCDQLSAARNRCVSIAERFDRGFVKNCASSNCAEHTAPQKIGVPSDQQTSPLV